MTLTASEEAPVAGSPPMPARPPATPRRRRAALGSTRLGLDLVAAGWAVSVLLGLFSYRGASPGFLLGAVLVAGGLVVVARSVDDPSVAAHALAAAGVAALGALAALVALALAAAGAARGVRAGDAVVLVALIAGAFGVVATFARLAERLGHRRLCLRWRRAGAVLLLAVVVAIVVALLAFAAGRPGANAGFWRAPFGRELPTPVPQLLLVVVGLAVGAAALALALAVDATRSWLQRLVRR